MRWFDLDWAFGIAVIIFISFILLYTYSKGFDAGYNAGHRKGFDGGKRAINEYVVKINHALGERIEEMNSRK